MKALVYTGIGQLEMQEMEMPKEEFVIKVIGSGVCGTDLKTYLKGHHFFKPPVVLGHELYGEVVKTPEKCDYKVGDIVVVAPYCECGECDICKKGIGQLCNNKDFVPYGSFLEYVGIPNDYIAKGIFKIPAVDDVYTLVEPLACVINGMEHLKTTPLSNVLVVGGGPMGALFALLFKDSGVKVSVAEPAKTRRETIESWGIAAFGPSGVNYSRFDNIVIAVNKTEIAEECIKKVADGGTVLLFSGLPKEVQVSMDSYAVHYREVTVTGSFGYNIAQFKTALAMIKKNPASFVKVITHKISLEQGTEGFQLLQNAEPLKLIFKL